MRWQIVVVAVVAVTAGCGGFVTDERTPTVTPVSVPATETPTDASGEVAPGLAESGVANVHELATAHRERLLGRSYTLREQIEIVPQRSGPSRSRTLRRTITVENETRYAISSTRVYRPRNGTVRVFRNYSEYVDGETRYARFERRDSDEVVYQNRSADANGTRFAAESNETIRRYLRVNQSNVTETEYNGRRYYLVRGTDPGVDPNRTMYNYSVTAYVNPSGFVRTLTATYFAGGGGRVSEYAYRFQYHDVGSTIVGEPRWLSTARNRTNATA